jgi:hypothetical protein
MDAFYDSMMDRGEGSPTCAPLADFRVLSASGEDAIAFLHGQLTQDVAGLGPDEARLAGYCTAKGRLLATMVIWTAPADSDSRLYALARADLADALVKRLSMFVLRSKAKLAAAPLSVAGVSCPIAQLADLQAAAGGPLPALPWRRADLPSGTWIAAPAGAQDPQPRWWWVADASQLAGPQAQALAQLLGLGDAQAWRAADLAAGLPWIGAGTQDLFIPQTVNLELAGGVSFTKGCYPGQEVVARSHYRGTVKRRMAYGRLAEAAAAPIAPGADVYDATHPNEPTGRVVDAVGAGLLFETTLASLPGGNLRLNAPDGPQIQVLPLPYPLEG